MTNLPQSQALWASRVLVDCLREAGDDIESGFAAAEYILSLESESYDYPRNKSNQFLGKLTIAAAARDDTEYRRLRDSLPEDQCWKLDSKVALLQGGGTVHHPSENPGLGVDINGLVVDPKWAEHEQESKCREEWQAREEARNERRRFANKATRSFRSEYRPLDRVKSLLKKAGATPSDLRSIDRIRHDFERDKIPEQEFERLYEEVIECVHLRIDEECLRDPEADFQDSSSTTSDQAFAVDRRGVSHRASGPTGGQFVPHGQEGPESAGESESTRTSTGRPPSDAGGGGPVQGQPSSVGTRVEGVPPGPDPQQADPARQDQGVPSSGEPTEGVPGPTVHNPATAAIERINTRIDHYVNHFRSVNDDDIADWLEEIREHITNVGPEAALESLGEEKRADIGHIAYTGTGLHDEDDEYTKYIKRYMARAGLYFQAGDDPVPGVQTIASYPIMESERHRYKPGDIIPGTTSFKDKLQEAKHLPGLESAEDIDTIIGSPTSHITQDVVSKLDEKFGEGKWIIKPYSDEAYAGYGILFPQRVNQLKMNARDAIGYVDKKLAPLGLSLARDDSGKIVGVTDGNTVTPATSRIFPIKNIPEEFTKGTPDQLHGFVQRMARLGERAGINEHGPMLPVTGERNMFNQLGISFFRDRNTNKPVGIVNQVGKVFKFGPELDKYLEENDEKGSLSKGIYRAFDTEQGASVKFMAQPAFEALNEDEAKRASGLTWSANAEGRVHVVVGKDGVAKAVPYATMAGRGEAVPVVFYDDEARAMEKAAEDAINAFPPSERNAGQVYAPDVMRAKDGWKVVEANAAVEEGSSSWLENNPLVMDAYISHLVGRDPAHVGFVRNLLRGRMTNTRKIVNQPPGGVKLSAHHSEDQPRKPAGTPGGGQWVREKNLDTVETVKHGKAEVRYFQDESPEISGPKLDLTNYSQDDYHSCGFVAALTVVDCLKLETPSKSVLKAVRPTIGNGVDRYKLKAGLEKLGIRVEYSKTLTANKLKDLVEAGTPVIISVWPEGWYSDHWTVVQGFDSDGTIHLTNYGSLSPEELQAEWSDMDMRGQGGSKEGFICTIKKPRTSSKDSAPAFSVDRRGVSHKSSGPTGGQFVPKGQEGPDPSESAGSVKTGSPSPVADIPPGGVSAPGSEQRGQSDDLKWLEEAPDPEEEILMAEFVEDVPELTEEDLASIEAQESISSTPDGRGQIRQKMSTSPIVNGRDISTGINKSILVTFDDGTMGVWKPSMGENTSHPALPGRGIAPGTQYNREIASHSLAEILSMGDLVPETVLREHEFNGVGENSEGRVQPYRVSGPGSVQRFLSGARTAQDIIETQGDVSIDPRSMTSADDRLRATIFDYITLNTDRHEGNWMLTHNNRVKLIDNGLAFPNKVSPHDLPSHTFLDEEVMNSEIPESIRSLAARHQEVARVLDNAGIEPVARDAAINRLKRLGNREIGTVRQYLYNPGMYSDYPPEEEPTDFSVSIDDPDIPLTGLK